MYFSELQVVRWAVPLPVVALAEVGVEELVVPVENPFWEESFGTPHRFRPLHHSKRSMKPLFKEKKVFPPLQKKKSRFDFADKLIVGYVVRYKHLPQITIKVQLF